MSVCSLTKGRGVGGGREKISGIASKVRGHVFYIVAWTAGKRKTKRRIQCCEEKRQIEP